MPLEVILEIALRTLVSAPTVTGGGILRKIYQIIIKGGSRIIAYSAIVHSREEFAHGLLKLKVGLVVNDEAKVTDRDIANEALFVVQDGHGTDFIRYYLLKCFEDAALCVNVMSSFANEACHEHGTIEGGAKVVKVLRDKAKDFALGHEALEETYIGRS